MNRRPFAMTKPCPECPFTKQPTAVRLTIGRARELANNMLSPAGATFSCHKTVDYSGDDGPSTHNAVHCAGALIFAEQSGNATQMMRIAERLGLYQREAMLADPDVVALVFCDKKEMLEAQRGQRALAKRGKA